MLEVGSSVRLINCNAQFPHLAQTKTEPRTKSSEDRSKQEWLREKQIEREERERLRRELEADRKLRAEKVLILKLNSII